MCRLRTSALGARAIPDRNPIVYIVEDDDAVRDALAVLLRSVGYPVAAFASARAFLDAYRPGAAGCLLVDLDLPEMDGPQLVGVLVARRIKLPAVLMSARMHNLRLSRNLPSGVVGILEKPFGLVELLQRLALALAPPSTH